jgi:spermidine synthase
MMNKDNVIPVTAGISLLAVATLLMEIALVRLFSVTMWYHFSFMVISIALFGFGASGAFLTVFRHIFEKDFRRTATLFPLFFSFSTIIAMLTVSGLSIDPFRIIDHPETILRLAVSYIVLAVPFFASGLCVGLILSKMTAHGGKIYFFNLLGSGIGCLAVTLTIPLFAPAGTIVLAAAMGSLATLCFNWKKSAWISVVALLVVIGELLLMVKVNDIVSFKIAPSKSLAHFMEMKEEPLLTRWNAFSRLDVLMAKDTFYAPGLSGKMLSRPFPPQNYIYIDADAVAPITHFETAKLNGDIFKAIPSSVAYQLKRHPSVCVIGAGGGFDVLTALLSTQPKDVTAVEINPGIAQIVREDFGKFSGHIYDQTNVKLEIAEGRTFIRNSWQQFDVIQLSLVDTWAAISSGAYSLSENYLYTKEAFSDYLNHLSPDGILTVTRWFTIPPNETLRIITMAVSALQDAGVSNPMENILLLRSERVVVILIKKQAFNTRELEQVNNICRTNEFGILYAPHMIIENIFYTYLISSDKNIFYAQYPFNIDPATDDRPFFFHFYGIKNLNSSEVWKLRNIDRNNISYLILMFLLAQAVILSIAFILGPLFFMKKITTNSLTLKKNVRWPVFLFFSAIGIAFMFTEVTLIQKFILFLGNPVYTLAVILSSLLISAGLGSLFSERVTSQNDEKIISWFLVAVAAMLLTYVFLLPTISNIFLGWGPRARLVACIFLIFPLGFFMGLPFPAGLKLTERKDSLLLPWAWGINGCFSVLGSILSVAVAMTFGFIAVLKCAAICYLVALLAVRRLSRP